MSLNKTTFNPPPNPPLAAKQVSFLKNKSTKPSLIEFVSSFSKRAHLSDKQRGGLYQQRMLQKNLANRLFEKIRIFKHFN